MLNMFKLQSLFAFGECATFAVALAEFYNYPILEMYDIKTQDFLHAVVEIPTSDLLNQSDVYLDSFGVSNVSNLKNRYQVRDCMFVESNTHDIAQVALINKSLFPEAKALIQDLIKTKLLPLPGVCM